VNFLIDAQLPPALARWIASQGHQAIHVFDTGLHAAGDTQIWEFARNATLMIMTEAGPVRWIAHGESAVIITKDEDFVDRWILSDNPVPLIWIRKGNCSNQALLRWLEPLWSNAVKRLDQGEKLIELRA
jgi:predicted nuclease of predicted toxin-antitoxin system